jgi:hypothetical protein
MVITRGRYPNLLKKGNRKIIKYGKKKKNNKKTSSHKKMGYSSYSTETTRAQFIEEPKFKQSTLPISLKSISLKRGN